MLNMGAVLLLLIGVADVPDRTPFIVRPLTVVLLLLAALGVYWALKKKKTSSPRDIALSSMAVDDDVLYAPEDEALRAVNTQKDA
ncbi:unnamed protein product [Gadus morhua 'NCC']